MSGRQKAAAVIAAALLDVRLGDPRRFHPVAGFGALAASLERRHWRPSRTAGALHAGILVGVTALTTGLIERRLPPRGRIGFAAIVLWTTLGGRSLAAVATQLARQVELGDLPAARRTITSLAGRNPSGLDGPQLSRAAIESVAENTADAVLAPLVWFAVAGTPGAAAYRAVNTLDAMVGHRSERYERFGWASARLDDLASWPAARLGAALAVCLAPTVGGSRARALAVLRRDGNSHPSPNAGRLEAAFAGALDVRLGGRLRYETREEERPTLGDGREPSPADVRRAVRLSRTMCLVAFAIAAIAMAGRQ